MANFQPPPIGDPFNSYRWVEWFRKLSGIFTAAGTVPWASVDKTGSNITDIATRTHNSLQSHQGGTTGEYYHLTSAHHTDLTDAGDSTLHYHATDRARANHTGTQTMSTISDLPTLVSGTYTPTLTNVANLDASTAYECQYLRVGSMVTVSGKVDADPTAAALVQLGISLPIASNFGAAEDCGGVAAAAGVAGQSAAIQADSTNDRAEMRWTAVDTSNRSMLFTFAYQVI